MHSDPIADLLTRIRNGLHARHDYVDVPYSRIKEAIVKILKDEGFIANCVTTQDGHKFPVIRIHLRYDEKRRPVIKQIRRVSKPGLRVYRGSDELRPLRSGLATRIVTTSSGVMTDREARKRRIGGEVLCEVW